MAGETNLNTLLQDMTPKLNPGTYVFVTLKDVSHIDRADTLCEFKETEGTTVVINKEKADALKLPYEFIASWITLEIHSSLDAKGLTAAFSTALAKHNLSCNVIAGYYHDHIFIHKQDADKAMSVLKAISEKP